MQYFLAQILFILSGYNHRAMLVLIFRHVVKNTVLTTYRIVTAAHVGSGQIMGWGEKAIEVRAVETGLLDGVFMHKRAQTFRFLCERNEKVSSFTKLAP